MLAAICFTPMLVYLSAKFSPKIAVKVEFVKAEWIVLTEASPVPSVAFVESALISSLCVPQGVRRCVMLAVLLAAEVAIEKRAAGVFDALSPTPKLNNCSGR